MKKTITQIDLSDIIVTAIIIAYNDEAIIEKVLRETNEVLRKDYPNYEILIVDNNSWDSTLNKVRNLYKKIPHIKIIKLSKTCNNDIAYTAGLDNCIGDYAVLIDIHLVSPHKIPSFLNKLVKEYDIVTAKSNEIALSKWSISNIVISIIERLSTHDFHYEPLYLLALNRRAINSITKVRRKSRSLSYISHSIGFRKTYLEYKPLKSYKSKIKTPNFIELLIIVTDIIISNSFKPIRILAAMGMLVSFAFLVYVILVILFIIFFHTYLAPKGWISIASVIGIMFFLLFSLLTIISEYIIRILNESRNEPLYFIADEMDESVITTKKNKRNVL